MIDLLQIEFMPICHLKAILLISEFAQNLQRPIVILPL